MVYWFPFMFMRRVAKIVESSVMNSNKPKSGAGCERIDDWACRLHGRFINILDFEWDTLTKWDWHAA
jgi:hypothetical protein